MKKLKENKINQYAKKRRKKQVHQKIAKQSRKKNR